MTRLTRDEWGLHLAEITALRGSCARRQVGCVLLDEHGVVLATGYNGPARGRPHCRDGARCPGADFPSGEGLDFCQAIHAEANALMFCPDVRRVHSCYVTVSPCVSCVKLLLNSGCRRIIFPTRYPQTDAAALWSDSSREWVHLTVPAILLP